MATFIISPLLGSSGFAAVDELTGARCWTRAKIKEVSVDLSSANSDQPVSSEQTSEKGTFVNLLEADINTLKIIQPSRMRVTMYCTDAQTIENVISSFENTRVTLTIQTKGITANNLVAVNIDITQSPEMMSAAKIVVDLEQAFPPKTSGYKPAQSADESSNGVSIQAPSNIAPTVTNLYNKVVNLLKGL